MSIHEKAAALLSSAGIPDPKAAGAEPAPDPKAAAPRSSDGAGAGSASADEASRGEGQSTSPVHGDAASTSAEASTHDVLAEKLRATRERNAATEERKRAKRDREEAKRARAKVDEDRGALEKERLEWSDLSKNGSILDKVKAAGGDVRQTFEAMKEEAIKAGQPEALVEKLSKKFDTELAAARKEVEDLRKERDAEKKTAADQATLHRFATDFSRNIVAPEFAELRVEHGDQRLFALADNLRNDTDAAVAYASQFGVRLTNPAAGLTMREILSVLKAAQEEHEREKTTRRTASTATTERTPTTAGSDPATVNGTAERRNAGPRNIGNDLATSTATGGKPKVMGTTPSARLREKARRLYG